MILPTLAASIAIYIGTAPGKGQTPAIYLCRLDTATGQLSEPHVAAATGRPSFLAAHPTSPYLYACDETSDTAGQKSGGVMGFHVDPASGALTEINHQISAGMGACFVEVHPSGKTLLVANYGSGSVASLPIDPATGKLAPAASVDQHHGSGPNTKRQEGPHAHCFRADPSGRFALSCDLGTDKLMLYRLVVDSAFTAIDPVALPAGSGPRHLAFSRDGKFLYIATELGNTVNVFSWDASSGKTSEVQTISTLPADFQGTSYASEIAVAPEGKHLYVANRGHDSIAVFNVDEGTGKIAMSGVAPVLGKFPRHFSIDPSGKWMVVADQNSGDVFVFAIDAKSGKLTPTESSVKVPGPTCIRFWTQTTK